MVFTILGLVPEESGTVAERRQTGNDRANHLESSRPSHQDPVILMLFIKTDAIMYQFRSFIFCWVGKDAVDGNRYRAGFVRGQT